MRIKCEFYSLICISGHIWNSIICCFDSLCFTFHYYTKIFEFFNWTFYKIFYITSLLDKQSRLSYLSCSLEHVNEILCHLCISIKGFKNGQDLVRRYL